jgi:AbrB family looped-hinge helix DNA binding protein
MEITKISSKYQVVIPRKIREQYNLKPGQKVAFIPFKSSLRLVLIEEIEKAYGFLEGIDREVERDEADRV